MHVFQVFTVCRSMLLAALPTCLLLARVPGSTEASRVVMRCRARAASACCSFLLLLVLLLWQDRMVAAGARRELVRWMCIPAQHQCKATA